MPNDEYAEAAGHTAPPVKKTAEEWKAFMIQWRAQDLASATKRLAEAEEHFAETTRWVTALYESLGMAPIEHDDFTTNPFKKKTTTNSAGDE